MQMNQLTRYVAPSIFVLVLSGCKSDPVGSAPKVEAKPAEQVAAPADSANAVVYPLNSENSTLKFVGAKVTKEHPGEFKSLSGEIKLSGEDPTKSSVLVTIEMKSLEIEPAKLDGHLRGPDFFDMEKYPQAQFQSTEISAGEGAQFNVTGNLTLHGVTKSITFPAKIELGDKKISVSAKFGINRKDFGIVYPGMPDDLIKDEVLIDLSLQPTQS